MKYQDRFICPRCGGDNVPKKNWVQDGIVVESETKCKQCNHENLWYHGHWEKNIKKLFRYFLKFHFNRFLNKFF